MLGSESLSGAWCAKTTAVILCLCVHSALASLGRATLVIPEVRDSPKRLITIRDVTALRNIDVLTISPDGNRYAIFVRQGDPITNDFRTGWFVGNTGGGALLYIGQGGQVGPGVFSNGQLNGTVTGSEGIWSPDGRWISYKLRNDGQVQVWRSRTNGSVQEQITHNAADIQEFVWSEDGRQLLFTAGVSRAEIKAGDEMRARHGYQYDEDLNIFTDAMKWPPLHSVQTDPPVWTLSMTNRQERIGGPSERANFELARLRQVGGIADLGSFYEDAAVQPIARLDGAIAWLKREKSNSRRLRVVASLSPKGTSTLVCGAEECSGVIPLVWWSEDGDRVLFWRLEGINERTHGFYAWSLSKGTVSTISRLPDDDFRHCAPAAGDQLICVRETPTKPAHVAAIDFSSGSIRVLADVNPEFHGIQLGKVERYEWDVPKFAWNEPGGRLAGLFGKRTYGYILFPPDFNPAKKYPVFIDPYVANGFNRQGSEHALHVYAANGFVVLNMAFPFLVNEAWERAGASLGKQLYSQELDYPELSIMAASTVHGLDVASSRGFVDDGRVGIGGVSTGTFVPLYILQKYDRIAAISISSPHWGPFQYYWGTRKLRDAIVAQYGKVGYESFVVKPEGSGLDFWNGIDIAAHVDTIEAPILMNLADGETFALLRLIRNLEDENKPYDAYIFPNETHVKWQPAHLQVIMNRNLDWFRFWLLDTEDPEPSKSAQYVRWRRLREQRDNASINASGGSH